MLTNEEMRAFHEGGVIVREGLLAGKIPFEVRTFSVGSNLAFAKSFDEIDSHDLEIHVNNFIALHTLKGCLVSFNGKKVEPESIESWSIEKCNHVINFWKQLSNDLIEYLDGYGEQEISDEELEEYIITDSIVREDTFNYGEEAGSFSTKYRVASIGGMKKITTVLKGALSGKKLSKLHVKAFSDKLLALETIEEINGVKITPENIDEQSIEMVGFITRRAANLERQLNEFLSSGEKMAEKIKN